MVSIFILITSTTEGNVNCCNTSAVHNPGEIALKIVYGIVDDGLAFFGGLRGVFTCVHNKKYNI